jgi:hypothetical protein
MGEIYRAHDQHLDWLIALETLIVAGARHARGSLAA